MRKRLFHRPAKKGTLTPKQVLQALKSIEDREQASYDEEGPWFTCYDVPKKYII